MEAVKTLSNYVHFEFIPETRCLIVKSAIDAEDYLFYKFYGEFEEINRNVKADIRKYLNEHDEIKSYSQSLDGLKQVEESHTIKVYFVDGDSLITRIRGTFDGIIKHYRNNNESYWNNEQDEKQVKKIEFIESHLLDENKTCKYLFIDWNETGLLS